MKLNELKEADFVRFYKPTSSDIEEITAFIIESGFKINSVSLRALDAKIKFNPYSMLFRKNRIDIENKETGAVMSLSRDETVPEAWRLRLSAFLHVTGEEVGK